MERELLQFETAGGQAVVVEMVEGDAAADAATPGPPPRPAPPSGLGGRDVGGPAEVERASRVGDVLVSKIRLDDALGVVRTTADAVVRQVRDLASQPDKVEVEFGIQLSSKVGAVIAAGEAQAHLKLKMTWGPKPATAAPPAPPNP